MEAALERIGRDAGVAAFWQELKRGSEKQRESVDARNAARESGDAVPDSWISWQEASAYYLKQGGLSIRVCTSQVAMFNPPEFFFRQSLVALLLSYPEIIRHDQNL